MRVKKQVLELGPLMCDLAGFCRARTSDEGRQPRDSFARLDEVIGEGER